MNVKVHFMAQLKRAIGAAGATVTLAVGATLGDLVAHLAQTHGDVVRPLILDDSGRPQSSLLFFVKDEQATGSRELRDGDEVTLLTPMSGADMAKDRPLTAEDRALYDWQLSVEGFGEEGQRRLKNSTVLVTRVGGVGGALATQLAVAGIGKIVLLHGGNLRPDDLNRQTLMSHAGVGTSRVFQAARRLRELNPRLEVEEFDTQLGEDISDAIVKEVDAIASCAPIFEERLMLNRSAVLFRKPLVDCAMFELDVQLTTVLPGQSACLECLYPTKPPTWKRRFPVFGAVAGAVGSLGAMEIIKVLTGLGQPLVGQMLVGDLRDMTFRKVQVKRNPACAMCKESRS